MSLEASCPGAYMSPVIRVAILAHILLALMPTDITAIFHLEMYSKYEYWMDQI